MFWEENSGVKIEASKSNGINGWEKCLSRWLSGNKEDKVSSTSHQSHPRKLEWDQVPLSASGLKQTQRGGMDMTQRGSLLLPSTQKRLWVSVWGEAQLVGSGCLPFSWSGLINSHFTSSWKNSRHPHWLWSPLLLSREGWNQQRAPDYLINISGYVLLSVSNKFKKKKVFIRERITAILVPYLADLRLLL